MSRLELAQPTCEDPDVLPTGLGTIRLYGESALAWPQTWLRTKIELKNDIISRVSHFISFLTLSPSRRLPHSVLEPDLLLDSSEERRVVKGWVRQFRYRWSRYHENKHKQTTKQRGVIEGSQKV